MSDIREPGCPYCGCYANLLDVGDGENISFVAHCRSCTAMTDGYPTIEEAEKAWIDRKVKKPEGDS